ncbi:hypothetical protein EVAR_5806_1 [Eumeta japonica]|uniref:Uncharacterized protein n=1 Tax=Eumeta variegata TaxID=151549 RepID=A0A4C1T4P1_EUMVA|nr:hypothetical protein EVAR_5806_1 [Eumeta japonica]
MACCSLYLALERPKITYFNKKYIKYFTITAKRHNRQSLQHYVDMHFETTESFGDNVTALKATVITARPLIGVLDASGANAYANEVHGHASPIKMYATHMCNVCTAPPIKCSGSGASDTVALQLSYCEARLNKEVKSERKRCPSFNRRYTARNPLNQKRALVKRSNPRFELTRR